MSFAFLARPKWVAWTLLVVVAVVVMANLSAWQWGRLQDRRETNAAIEARTALPVVAIDDASLDGLGPDALRYRRVTATGVYLDDAVLIANQTFGGAPGWWVVTPLRTTSGLEVWVNRGWIPFASATPGGSLEAFAPPDGEVTVSGIVQVSQSPVEGVAPDADALPRLDVSLLAERAVAGGLGSAAPVWLQLEEQLPAQPGGQPLPVLLPPLDDGPHLNYTGQWAIFATLTLVIYVVLVVRTAQRGGDGPGTARRASTGRESDPEVLAMCAARLAPLRSPDVMAGIVGMPVSSLVDHLDAMVATGLARHHTTAPPGWTLTPAGHAELERRLAAELDAEGLRPRVRGCYDRFVPLNERLLAIITDWQVRTTPEGALELNDHADPAADAAVLARLGALDDEAGPLCDELGVALARFGGYRHRLATARRRLESGEAVYLDGMQVDSYHLVWFELHEHLLATLGIPRGGDEPATAVPGGVGQQGE